MESVGDVNKNRLKGRTSRRVGRKGTYHLAWPIFPFGERQKWLPCRTDYQSVRQVRDFLPLTYRAAAETIGGAHANSAVTGSACTSSRGWFRWLRTIVRGSMPKAW